MNSTALIVSDDLILRSEARSLLSRMQIVCTCSGVLGFKRVIESTKVDAIVLDVANWEETAVMLDSVRTGKCNRYSIVVALLEDSQSASAARTAGANFMIRRSNDIREDLKKAFESAYGLILRERRRYERHPIEIDVEMVCNGKSSIARMLDISERGACLECPFPIPMQPLLLGFSLPGLKQHLRVQGVPAWARAGKLGIQFTSIAEASQAALCEWLTSRMPIEARFRD